MAKGFEILKISGIKYLEKPVTVEEKEELYKGVDVSESIRSKVDTIFERYTPYITFERKFPLDTTREALGAEFREPPDITDGLIARLLGYAVEHNFGHPVRRRRKIIVQSQSTSTEHSYFPLVAVA